MSAAIEASAWPALWAINLVSSQAAQQLGLFAVLLICFSAGYFIARKEQREKLSPCCSPRPCNIQVPVDWTCWQETGDAQFQCDGELAPTLRPAVIEEEQALPPSGVVDTSADAVCSCRVVVRPSNSVQDHVVPPFIKCNPIIRIHRHMPTLFWLAPHSRARVLPSQLLKSTHTTSRALVPSIAPLSHAASSSVTLPPSRLCLCDPSSSSSSSPSSCTLSKRAHQGSAKCSAANQIAAALAQDDFLTTTCRPTTPTNQRQSTKFRAQTGAGGEEEEQEKGLYSDVTQPQASVSFVSETLLPMGRGKYRVRAYHNWHDNTEPMAIIHGKVEGRENVPIRVHDACFTSEVLGSLKCDCKQQLDYALDYVKDNAPGMVLYLQQEGRGMGLAYKIKAYNVQEFGLDTVDANNVLGFDDDTRTYTCVPAILSELGVRSVRLMTNNPMKIAHLQSLGVRVTGRIPVITSTNTYSHNYLQAKKSRMGHML